MVTAINCGHADALHLLLRRGTLARTVGLLPSLLHRPGMTVESRLFAAGLMLKHLAAQQPDAGSYREAVRDAVNAGACLREGAMILAILAQGGHLEAAFGESEPVDKHDSSRSNALRDALKLNERVRRISWSTSGAQASRGTNNNGSLPTLPCEQALPSG